MKVTNEKTENSQVFLRIEMEPTEVEESLEKSYQRLVKKAKVPGFRKGKSPRAVLERYIGKESLLEDALNNLLPQACGKAIKEQEIEAIAQPQIEVTQTDPVVFKAIVPLRPQVKLGDYHHIRVTPELVEVTKSDISTALEQLRHQHATWEPMERELDFGDSAVLDIESGIEDKPFINRQGVQYQILREQSFPAPGFGEQLAGMKRNEHKEFKLQFPSDYPSDELAGKEPWFKVKITETKREILPELNNEFASGIDPNFKSLASLRKKVSSDLELRAEEKARLDLEERVIDTVVGLTEVQFPPILVETEIHRILNQRFQGGSQELEEYLISINKTGEELHEEMHPLATKRITQSLVLGKIVEEEKIEVSDSEIDTEISNINKEASENKDELENILNTPQAREAIEQTLIARKAVQRLVEIANGPKVTKTTIKKKRQKTEIIQKQEAR
ncbi:trigger factor [Chloroflexota bacterium]